MHQPFGIASVAEVVTDICYRSADWGGVDEPTSTSQKQLHIQKPWSSAGTSNHPNNLLQIQHIRTKAILQVSYVNDTFLKHVTEERTLINTEEYFIESDAYKQEEFVRDLKAAQTGATKY